MLHWFATMAHKVANDILIPEIARLVASGQQVVFTPTGVSMRPYIEGGRDSVVLTQPGKISVGDVVLARFGSIYVLHRVIAVSDTMVTLMGDGNLSGQETLPIDDVLARVCEIRSPRGKRKPITRAFLWRKALPIRWLLLKIYRKIFLRIFYRV